MNGMYSNGTNSIGKLAISRSGRDKGRIYVIIKEEEADVYIADGKLRTIENPKRKNKKHIQIIKKLPKEITEMLTQNRDFRNEEVKRAIKLYKNAPWISLNTEKETGTKKNQGEYNQQEV